MGLKQDYQSPVPYLFSLDRTDIFYALYICSILESEKSWGNIAFLQPYMHELPI